MYSGCARVYSGKSADLTMTIREYPFTPYSPPCFSKQLIDSEGNYRKHEGNSTRYYHGFSSVLDVGVQSTSLVHVRQ